MKRQYYYFQIKIDGCKPINKSKFYRLVKKGYKKKVEYTTNTIHNYVYTD